MRKQRWGLLVTALAGALVIGVGTTSSVVLAQTSTSNNYQMVESQFGNTGTAESCSSEYCAQVTIGDEGRSSSATSPEFGEANYTEPTLEMIVESGESHLGDLTAEHSGIKLMNIKVRNYQSGGYMLQIIGSPPSIEGHTLKAMSEIGEPMQGTEQFGINVVANTVPDKVGEDPKYQPSGDDATDLVMSGYNTPNIFKYIDGDTIVTSTENTGGADFTVTMIVNISSTTPAGLYAGDFAAIILPYF